MSYEPHSAATKVAYENFLREARRWAPPGLESFLSFCEELIELIHSGRRSDTPSIARESVCGHFGRTIPNDACHRLIELALQLTDFISSGGDASDADSLSGSEDTNSDSAGNDKLRDDDALMGTAAMSDSEESDDDLLTKRIPFKDVASNPHYLQEAIRSLFPSTSPPECEVLGKKVLDFLRERGSDSGVVETQLTACLGAYDDDNASEWISKAVESRWSIVYGLAFAAATSQNGKDRVIHALSQHAKENRDAEALYLEVTGKDADVANRRGAADDDSSTHEFALRPVDVSGLQFADERSPFRSTKVVVPRGVQFETHQEIVLPPSDIYRGEVKRTPISDFPAWARVVFPDTMTSLNRMQSIVFPCAFQTSENMLVCAPTGAGKTNVAVMAVLRCLQDVYHPSTGEFDVSALKMVYVAPMKALVQEVVQAFTKRLAPLGIRVAELSGDASLSKQQLAETQLIVTTPEKWDVVTRKSMDLGVAPLVRLIIVDEIHLLHNDRGPVLEAIIARFKLQASLRNRSDQQPARLVGLSATLPNFEDVASFMQVDRTRGLFHFDSSFREVPLRQTYCQSFRVKGMNSAEVLNTIAYKKVMEHAHHEQVMVFVHSRKDTEFTASFLLQKARFENKVDSIMRPGSDSERTVHQRIGELENSGIMLRESLRQLLPRGFAIHHAGMSREERSLVEELFLHRHIKVLVCTSTLAWGVNLPANAVVVKGTQVFSAEKGGMSLLSVLDVLQMFGRAGRVGFGSSLGEACIITSSAEDLSYYLGALNQQLPIESRFMGRLIDSLNAEIVLGSVQNIRNGVQWLQGTYFYVRMRQHPQLYGCQGATSRDPLCHQHLHNLVHTAALHLQSSKLIEYDQTTRSMRSTELGRIASHYYLVHESMRTYLQNMWEGMHEADLFRLFSLSHEFSHISVRPDESVQIKELLSCCPIAVGESYNTTSAKVNVLLQCYIANLSLTGLPLMSELVYIKDSGQRILRALYDVAVERGFGKTAREILRMYLMVVHRQWYVQSPLRQVRQLMSTQSFHAIVDAFESRRMDWDTIRKLSIEDLQEVLKRDRLADVALECIRAIPQYEVQVAARPLTSKLLYLDVDVSATFDFNNDLHSKNRELLLTVEHTNGTILHHESLILPLDRLQQRDSAHDGGQPPLLQLTIAVPLVEPKPCFYFVRLLSPGWIGCEVCAPVSLMNITVPVMKLPLIEVGDMGDGDDNEEEACLVETLMKPYHLEQVATKLFSFSAFSKLQRNVLEAIFSDAGHDLFVGVPPGAGKTVIAELFVLRFLSDRKSTDTTKLLYVTAMPAVAARRFEEWNYKFSRLQGVNEGVALLTTSDTATPADATRKLTTAPIVITTPDALMPLLRRGGDELHRFTHVVVDHAHLLRDTRMRSFESVVSRLMSPPFLLRNGEQRPRLLVLSLPCANCEEVCKWLKIRVAFNHGKSFSRFQTQFVSCNVSGYQNRYAQAVSMALRLLTDRENALTISGVSKVVFTPNARDAFDFAEQLVQLRHTAGEGDLPLQLEGLEVVDELEDKRLARLLRHGVGVITSRTTAEDLALMLLLTEEPPRLSSTGAAVPLTVIATFEVSWRLPAAVFELSIVCLPERSIGSSNATNSNADELGSQLYSDCSMSEVLQMATRGQSRSMVYCRKAQRWTLHQFLNEPSPLESCNRDAYDFREAINAAIAQGYVTTMHDVLSVLKTHYLFHHLKSNPSFHGLQHDTERGRYLSAIAGEAVQSLADDLGCIVYKKDALQVSPTAVGVAAAYHCVSMDTLDMIRTDISDTSTPTLAAVLLAVCRADELRRGDAGDALRIRRYEGAAMQVAARSLRSAFGVDHLALDYAAVETKAFLLTLLRCARWKWSSLPSHVLSGEDRRALGGGDASAAPHVTIAPLVVLQQLDDDSDAIVGTMTRLLLSAVELVKASELGCVQLLMCLVQSTQRSVWVDEGDIQQLPTTERFEDLSTSCQLASLGALRRVVGEGRSAVQRQLEGWARSWRPQLASEAQIQKKRTILETFLIDEGWCSPMITALSAKAELNEVSEGSFVCVVNVSATFVRGDNIDPAGSPPQPPLKAWIACYNHFSNTADQQQATTASKLYALRLVDIDAFHVDPQPGTATDAYPTQTCTVTTKVLFPLEEIEDENAVCMKVSATLTTWRVQGECTVPFE